MVMTNAKRRPASLQRVAGLLAILLMVTSGALAADRLPPTESGQADAGRRAAACITLPAQGKSFMRSSLICNDATSCNRVVIDLASLADFAAQPATVADAGTGALEATLKRMVSHMRRGYVLRRGTAATLMLNPTVGLHNGDSLEVYRVDCRSELA